MGPLTALVARGALAVLRRLPDRSLAALARVLFSRSWRAFEEACEDPARVQLDRLRLLCWRAKDTEFGRAHDFASIRSFEDYRARVPIRDYDGFEPWIQRMVAGEADVLIPGRPSFFARSSGTTGRPKYVPVTPVYLAEYRTPRRVWMRQVMQAFPGLLRGRILTVHSPKIEGRTADGVPYGSITVAMSGSPDAGEVPGDLLRVDPVPRRVFLVEDYDVKYYVVLRLAAQERITLAAAINPSTLVLLADKLDAFADRLAADLESGGCDVLDRLEPTTRAEVAARLRRDPEAAARLRAAKTAGRPRPTDLWPDIVGLLCWKGGSAPFYLARLEALFPGRRIMDYGYLATEGGFSIPTSPDGAKGVVSVGGHVLEFIPEAARARGESGPCLLAHELEPGQRYRVIVSGSHGLYRYDINDVVECVGRFRNTAEIAFVHKGGNMLSITGEKIAESHVVEAFRRAGEVCGVPLSGFSVSVELAAPPRYVFGLEAGPEVEDARLAQVAAEAERALCAVNIEYAAKRESQRLGPPSVLRLEPGAFERERRRRVAEGAPDSHVKPPHLMPELARLQALGVARALPEAT